MIETQFCPQTAGHDPSPVEANKWVRHNTLDSAHEEAATFSRHGPSNNRMSETNPSTQQPTLKSRTPFLFRATMEGVGQKVDEGPTSHERLGVGRVLETEAVAQEIGGSFMFEGGEEKTKPKEEDINPGISANQTPTTRQKETMPKRGRVGAAEKPKRRQSQVDSLAPQGGEKEKVLKLSPAKIHELTSSPDSLPVHAVPIQVPSLDVSSPEDPFARAGQSPDILPETVRSGNNGILLNDKGAASATSTAYQNATLQDLPVLVRKPTPKRAFSNSATMRPPPMPRAVSTPSSARIPPSPTKQDALQAGRNPFKPLNGGPGELQLDNLPPRTTPSLPAINTALPSPMPSSFPLPPLSIPTYLHLELSSHRPSPLYIHRSAASDFPYESSRVKIERLLNFLLLPPQLEVVLWFGGLACLDAWLYTFTILPLRLLKSFYILAQSWAQNLVKEIQFVSAFIFKGTGRMWRRRRSRGKSASNATGSLRRLSGLQGSEIASGNDSSVSDVRALHQRQLSNPPNPEFDRSLRNLKVRQRVKTIPSSLLPDDKADILKGLLIIFTCLILMRLDASRMYHWIRGQAAIKLYVIYNVLEVCDKLFSALGQDVLECLFSREALERKPDGHSKVLLPLWLFMLALIYTTIHATALFYQVITLNVAVNSYSNALITLLMSNQFVEIKSTVFKKFEKDNLFQLTCADVVERFQLWLMLIIIASRNIVETGGLNMGFSALSSGSFFSAPSATNTSNVQSQTSPSRSSNSILPRSFTLLPTLLSSLTAYAPTLGHVLGPFLVVLGSEMLVDWLKHAYIGKFNNTQPAIYGRFLDVLAKDYYSNAFADQNLTKRLGLPVIPLSCLFIRASVQTYHMFLAAWIPPSSAGPSSSAMVGLTNMHNHYSTSPSSPGIPTSTSAVLSQTFDNLLRRMPKSITSSTAFLNLRTIIFFLVLFLVLLAIKLVLGMVLLSFSRARYRSMKQREKKMATNTAATNNNTTSTAALNNNNSHQHQHQHASYNIDGGKRVGGWGVVEVDDDKKRWIYVDDPDGAKAIREREEKERVRREKEKEKVAGGADAGLDRVKRYEMVAKRIW